MEVFISDAGTAVDSRTSSVLASERGGKGGREGSLLLLSDIRGRGLINTLSQAGRVRLKGVGWGGVGGEEEIYALPNACTNHWHTLVHVLDYG